MRGHTYLFSKHPLGLIDHELPQQIVHPAQFKSAQFAIPHESFEILAESAAFFELVHGVSRTQKTFRSHCKAMISAEVCRHSQ